jgi:hypothetical protein
MPTSFQPRCGQFTFYFSKCGHATSHNYHRTPKSGENCNSNCIYDKNIDYWFWAGKDKRCSFCGLGQEHGFGTQHPVPEDEGPRLLLFEKVKEGMTLEEPDDVYNARFDEAAAWYNRRALEEIGLTDARTKEQTPNSGTLRTQRRLRFKNRREVRRLRAKRRTERWVQNIRDEQYRAVKASVAVGKQPFIIGGVGNPYTDLFSKVFVISLAQPIDNCVMCQYPLDNIAECGGPYSLPCGHMFHLNCMEELFTKRAESDEKEVFKCPLCNVWFRDLREVPDFYDKYWRHQQEFNSNASSSILSASDDGEQKGDRPPPWIFRPEELFDVPEWLEKRTGTRSNIRLRGAVQNSLASQSQAETEADNSSPPQPARRPGTHALLSHLGTTEQVIDVEPDELQVRVQSQPEVAETNSTIANTPSMEIGNNSLSDAGNSLATNNPPAAATSRARARRRNPDRQRVEGDERPRKRRKR